MKRVERLRRWVRAGAYDPIPLAIARPVAERLLAGELSGCAGAERKSEVQ